MKRSCLPVLWWSAMLSVVVLGPVETSLAEDPPATEPAPASAPAAVCPEAYRIQPNHMLVYRVQVTRRSLQDPNAPEPHRWRELAVFDVDDDGNLALYIGVVKEESVAGVANGAAAPAQRPVPAARSGQRPALSLPTPAPTPAEAEPEAPRHVEITWKKHSLGKSFARNDDGTITYRPSGNLVVYPVLPLPPVGTGEKERFEITVPDIAVAPDKTLRLSASWRGTTGGKVTIEARLDARTTPGRLPEMAIFSYDVPREAGAVSRVLENRRLAAEPATAGEAPAPVEAPRPIPSRDRGERGERGERGPRPAVQAPPRPAGPPVTTVAISLSETKVLSPEQHRGLIAMIARSQPAAPAEEGKPAEKPEETTTVPPEVRSILDRLPGM